MIAEANARNTILNILNCKFPGRIWPVGEQRIELYPTKIEGITQPAIWSLMAVMAASSQNIYFGYIRGDDL